MRVHVNGLCVREKLRETKCVRAEQEQRKMSLASKSTFVRNMHGGRSKKNVTANGIQQKRKERVGEGRL